MKGYYTHLWYQVLLPGGGGGCEGLLRVAQQQHQGGVHAQGLCDVSVQDVHGAKDIHV
jgi:hypothetical protein